MKYILLALSLAIAVSSSAQQPFPTAADAPTWNVLTCTYGIGVWCSTSAYQFTDTSSVCGHEYSYLLSPGWPAADTLYVRNDNSKTLFRQGSDCSDKEYLMYDYSMSVGDTVYAGMLGNFNDPDTARFVLDSIGTTTLQGIERRVFHMEYEYCGFDQGFRTMDWVEGIGSTTHPFYLLACLCDYCESSYNLLCSDSAGVNVYKNEIFNVCDTLITGIQEVGAENTGLTIFQDHANAELVVRIASGSEHAGDKNLHFTLYGTDGRVEFQGPAMTSTAGERRVPLTNISLGVHVIRIGNNKGPIAARRLYIE